MKKTEKTNVMRLLDVHNITYNSICYVDTGCVSGRDVANVLNENPDRVFKTLVTRGHSNNHYVFVIPVNRELNLKKAATSVNEKSISMIKSKELLTLTGYVHGGCSPIGMKKVFETVIDSNVEKYEMIFVSAGKIGYQVELDVHDLGKIIHYEIADVSDVIRDEEI